MSSQEIKQGLLGLAQSIPTLSAHEHHKEDVFFAKLDLDNLIEASYAGWCGVHPNHDVELRNKFFEEVRFNSYWRWLWEGIKAAHGMEGEFRTEQWEDLSARIFAAHKADPQLHINLLKRAGYERLIQDAYWNPGDDMGHPDIFATTFRIDSFLYGFHEDAKGPVDFKVWEHYNIKPKSLAEYVEWIKTEIRRRREAGAVALKSAEAYNRPLDYEKADKKAAERVWGKPQEKAKTEEKLAFGRYIFNVCVEAAQEFDIPFQVHLGLGQLTDVNPMTFLPTIQHYPSVRFVLFHYGYPWIHEIHGIIHNYKNAYPDFTWLPLIAPRAAKEALSECIEVVQNIKTIGWGSDCWTAEESTGAIMAWRDVVVDVLAEKVADGYINLADAEKLVAMLMRENWKYIYGR